MGIPPLVAIVAENLINAGHALLCPFFSFGNFVFRLLLDTAERSPGTQCALHFLRYRRLYGYFDDRVLSTSVVLLIHKVRPCYKTNESESHVIKCPLSEKTSRRRNLDRPKMTRRLNTFGAWKAGITSPGVRTPASCLSLSPKHRPWGSSLCTQMSASQDSNPQQVLSGGHFQAVDLGSGSGPPTSKTQQFADPIPRFTSAPPARGHCSSSPRQCTPGISVSQVPLCPRYSHPSSRFCFASPPNLPPRSSEYILGPR